MGTGFKHGERGNGLWPKDMYVCVATCSNMYMYSLAQFSKPKNNTTTTNEGKYIYLNVPNTEYPGIIKVERRLFKTEYSVHNSKSISVCGTHITTQLDMYIHIHTTCTPTICAQNHTWVLLYKYVHMYMSVLQYNFLRIKVVWLLLFFLHFFIVKWIRKILNPKFCQFLKT